MEDSCLNCKGVLFETKHHIKRTGNNISACKKCGLVQVHPRKDILNMADFEDHATRDKKLNSLFGLMKEGLGPKLKEMVEREASVKKISFSYKVDSIKKYKSTGALLDVGCAQGAFLSSLLGSGFDLYGVEPSNHASTEALKLGSEVTIYNATLLEAKFPDNKFDVVTLINTIEHLLCPKETLAEAFRILKPGGVLMVETPNVDHWIPSLMGKRWIQFLVPDHVVFFSKTTLSDMLNEIGFSIKEFGTSRKVMSLRFLLFHMGRYVGGLSRVLISISEKLGLAEKNISIPQWDEMIVLAVKNGKT